MAENLELAPHAEILLKSLIASYAQNGQPVGFKALVKYSALDISSATIRNIMAYRKITQFCLE